MITEDKLANLAEEYADKLDNCLTAEDKFIRFTLILAYPATDNGVSTSLATNFDNSESSVMVMEQISERYRLEGKKAKDKRVVLVKLRDKDKKDKVS